MPGGVFGCRVIPVRRYPGFEVFQPIDDPAAKLGKDRSISVKSHLCEGTDGKTELFRRLPSVEYEKISCRHSSITVIQPENPGK